MRTHKKTNATTQQATPKTIAVLGVVLAALLLGGCYWTPDSNEGDVAVSITIPGSSVGSQDVGALQTTNGTFLYAYVLDESLMTVNPSQAALIHARIAYGDVTYAMEQALAQADYNVTNAASGFSMPVGLASNLFQQLPIAATTATGSQAFTNLPAGREFLVGVYGVNRTFDGEVYNYNLYVGHGTATVQAGSTTSVNIELSDNPIPFFDYIGQNYGLARVDIIGTPFQFWGYDGAPRFFDLLSEDSVVGPSSGVGNTDFLDWYTGSQQTVIDSTGEQISKSGTRRPLVPRSTPEDGDIYTIAGIVPDRSWRLLITNWSDRASATGDFATLDQPLNTAPGAAVVIESYDGMTYAFTEGYIS